MNNTTNTETEMMNIKFEIGQQVKRINTGDYTEGRLGTVVDIDHEKSRVRVLWDVSPKPIRTWVRVDGVAAVIENQTSN